MKTWALVFLTNSDGFLPLGEWSSVMDCNWAVFHVIDVVE